MNRRAFLTALGLGAVGTVVVGQVTQAGLWMPTETTYALPPKVSSAQLLTIDEITHEALRLLESNLTSGWRSRLFGPRFSEAMVDGVVRLGDRVNDVTITDQLCISLQVSGPDQPIDSDQWLIPAMGALANGVRERHLSVCAPLSLVPTIESAIATNPTRSLALRGSRMFQVDPITDDGDWLLHFDILGGRA